MAKIAQRKLLGETSRLEISSKSPRCGQDTAKKAFLVKPLAFFLVKSLALRFQDDQDEARDVAKIGSRKLSW